MTFTYHGNQLVKASDAGKEATLSMSRDFKNGEHMDVEYAYDANGNMTMDANNGIYSIAYNVLNLPKKVTFAGNGDIMNEYVYSASGRKLSVVHRNAGGTKRTNYVGNLVYENDSLDMILVDGGYIKDGQYHFYFQDHLGSNRVVADAKGNVEQANHYYPYGTPFAESYNPDKQSRKYIGKEYDTENGLDWYDFEARFMDGTRFTTMDPLAEKYYSISPYTYCAGNPVKYVDPDGRDGMITGTGTKDDPYVITAMYYYQKGTLDDQQVKGLNEAVNAYNQSGGKNGVKVKNEDGTTSYVKYDLSAAEVDNVDEARLNTAFQTSTGETRYYGNEVNTAPDASGEEFGSANGFMVSFNVENINAGVGSGMNSNSLNKGVAIHEIGHNLGGEHSDGTSVMTSNVMTTTITSQIGGATTIIYSYPSMSDKFTKVIFSKRDNPRISGSGRVWTHK